MSHEEIYRLAVESILEGDEDLALKALEEARKENINLLDMLSKGFSPGMQELGDLFGRGEVFLPELMMAAAVMRKATEIIEESLEKSEIQKKGSVLIGTVAGDVHDIGKGIVISLLKTNGFDVFDIGREVPAHTFLEKAEELKVDFIGSSALLTTTMPEQKVIEDLLKKEGLKGKYKTIVGGAPVTKRWADKIGADAYCEDAPDAVRILSQWAAEKGK